MDEKFVKLEKLLTDENKIKEVFGANAEEALANLAAEGIEFTEQEFAQFLEGVKSSAVEDDELSEEDLENVAGGCKDCESQGREFGKKVGKVLKFILPWLFK